MTPTDLKLRVSFGIYGKDLDFTAISRELGVQPSDTHRIGDRLGSGKPFPHDMWLLSSPLPRSRPLDSHLDWLSQLLLPHCEYIRSLKREARLMITCWVQAFADGFDFKISPAALRIFVELDLPWGISALIFGKGE